MSLRCGIFSARYCSTSVFTIGRPKLNKKAGTATLVLDLPDPGTITLTGRGVRRQRLRRRQQAVAGAARKVKAGRARLLVQAKGRAKLRLQRSGQVKVRIRVVYKPKGEASDGPAQKSIDVKTETLRLRKTRG